MDDLSPRRGLAGSIDPRLPVTGRSMLEERLLSVSDQMAVLMSDGSAQNLGLFSARRNSRKSLAEGSREGSSQQLADSVSTAARRTTWSPEAAKRLPVVLVSHIAVLLIRDAPNKLRLR